MVNVNSTSLQKLKHVLYDLRKNLNLSSKEAYLSMFALLYVLLINVYCFNINLN